MPEYDDRKHIYAGGDWCVTHANTCEKTRQSEAQSEDQKTLLQEIQTWPVHARANLFGILADHLTPGEIVHQLTKTKLDRELEEIRTKL